MIFQPPKLTPLDIATIDEIRSLRLHLSANLQTSKRWTGILRRNLLARAIQGSNTIEGYHVTFDDAVAVVEGENVDVDLETKLAVSGYRNALTYILQLSDAQHLTFNEELIRSLHYMMLSHKPDKHPGLWRPGPIFVRREDTGERVYEGPDGDLVPSLMGEFVEDVQRTDDDIPVIIKAAMAHLNLVMIHPFSDGNGRMGRAVQTFILAREGILNPVFSSIEEYLGARNNTAQYYEVLAQTGKGSWRPEESSRPWIDFCLRAHLRQMITVKRRMLETANLWIDLEHELLRKGLNERMMGSVYEAAMGLRVYSSRHRSYADVSVQVASLDLRVLVNQGFLLPKGEKRGRYYVGTPFLLEIRQRNRQPRIALEIKYRKQLGLDL